VFHNGWKDQLYIELHVVNKVVYNKIVYISIIFVLYFIVDAII